MMDGIETFGKYRLLERVAIGGMAEIFKASTTGVGGFERFVAIKRLHRHLSEDEELAQMLVDEAKITVLLQHANIAQVFDLGMLNGQYFIVMEYIDGTDLYGVLRRMREQSRTMPVPLALYAISKMLGGLDYAHNSLGPDRRPLNIIHRDISPQNIMINTRGEVKLVDFGIAKARMRLMETQAGIIKGKFYYMAPEQAHGHHLDRRTDIFAAGMVLYELLTNRPAYEEANDLALLKRVRVCDFQPPSAWRRDVDPHLEGIVMQALKRDPNLRFQSARDFQQALNDYIQRRYGAINEHHLAEFIQELLEPTMHQSMPVQDYMQRDSYKTNEHSLIFDASDLAIPEPDEGFFDEHTIVERSGPNPFATEEATHVFMRDEDNPFAIPDEFSSEATHAGNVQWAHPLEENTAPRQRAASAQHQSLPQNPRPKVQIEPPTQIAVQSYTSGPSPFANPSPLDASAETKQRVQPRAPAPQPARPQAPPRGTGFDPSPRKEETPATQKVALIDRIKQTDRRVLIGVLLGLLLLFAFGIALSMGGDDKNKTSPKPIAKKTDTIAPKDTKAAPVKPAEPEKVSLPVNSTPNNASVFVNGALIGTTPISIPMLEVGKEVKLKVTKKDYKTWEQKVLIAPKPQTLELKLEEDKKGKGVIKVVTNPSAVRVEINGKFVGKSPIEEGNIDTSRVHTVVAVMDDGTMKREKVVWADDDARIKQVEMIFVAGKGQTKRDLPGPPVEKDEPKKQISRRTTNRRRNSYRKPRTKRDENPKDVNIWGGTKKKKPAPKKDDDENVNVWGG